MPGDGHPVGRRPLDGRCRLAPRPPRRREHLHRARGQRPELPQHPAADRGRRGHGRRGDPPRLRLPRRERDVRRDLPGVQHPLHRPEPGGDPPPRGQGPRARARAQGGRAPPARQRRGRARRGGRAGSSPRPSAIRCSSRRRWGAAGAGSGSCGRPTAWRRPCGPARARRPRRSDPRRSTSRSTWRAPATSRCRSWPTAAATRSTWASGTAPSSAATRSSWRSRRARS